MFFWDGGRTMLWGRSHCTMKQMRQLSEGKFLFCYFLSSAQATHQGVAKGGQGACPLSIFGTKIKIAFLTKYTIKVSVGCSWQCPRTFFVLCDIPDGVLVFLLFPFFTYLVATNILLLATPLMLTESMCWSHYYIRRLLYAFSRKKDRAQNIEYRRAWVWEIHRA